MSASVDYLLGIKGVGMTALAGCLIDCGHTVLGADGAEDYVTATQLNQLGITVDLGYLQPIPETVHRVIMSTALNPLSMSIVKDAESRQIPIVSHAQALGQLAQTQQVVAVCGVGGKSTVSAMLAHYAQTAHIPCSFAVGVGEIIGLSRTGKYDKEADYFVVEADEYADNPYAVKQGTESLRPRFSYFYPHICICTNLQYDHPDVYSSLEHTQAEFYRFFNQIQQQGALIWNSDDQTLTSLVDKLRSERPDLTYLSYGTQKADYLLSNISMIDGASQCTLNQEVLVVRIPGLHNLLNASAAYIACQVMNWEPQKVIAGLASFQSTARRCQLIKQTDTSIYYDDYAHHPHEIKAILAGLRAWYPRHWLTVAFQPHTVSRSRSLLKEFATSFSDADQVIILPVFSSARENASQGDAQLHIQLAELIAQQNTKQLVSSAESFDSARQQITSKHTHQLIVTLGAGDVYLLHDILSY